MVYGRSLGGAIGAWLVREVDPALLVLESSFVSIPAVGRDVYPYLPVRLLSRYNYSTAEYLKECRCPVVIIHSTDDEMINFRHGQALLQAAPEPKHLIETKGSHNESFPLPGGDYEVSLRDVLHTYMKLGN